MNGTNGVGAEPHLPRGVNDLLACDLAASVQCSAGSSYNRAANMCLAASTQHGPTYMSLFLGSWGCFASKHWLGHDEIRDLEFTVEFM